MTTFKRLEKIILKGLYNKDEILLDLNSFIELNTISEEEKESLIQLLEKQSDDTIIAFEEPTSDNIYLLLKKQIINKAYHVSNIETLVTDFRITRAINIYQLDELIKLIKEIYYPNYNVDIPEIEDTNDSNIIVDDNEDKELQ